MQLTRVRKPVALAIAKHRAAATGGHSNLGGGAFHSMTADGSLRFHSSRGKDFARRATLRAEVSGRARRFGTKRHQRSDGDGQS
jgi:hypothetical protein